MKRSVLGRDEIDRRRRAFLLRSLALGALAGGAGWNAQAYAALFGRAPYRLPEGKSVFDVKGQVTADGKPVDEKTVLSGREVLVAGPGSHLVAVVGRDAFILREQSHMELSVAHAAKSVFRLVSGALLTVFGPRRDEDAVSLTSPVATLGIRGTGAYMEVDAEKSYVCLCYGKSSITPAQDPTQAFEAVSHHHDMPKYILVNPENGERVVPAPFKNHTDLELMTIEALVGRTVPFGAAGDQYDAPKRDDY
jgi:hypothetical protein